MGGNGRQQTLEPPATFERSRLLYPCATPLNEDYQHDNKKQRGGCPDDRGSVHIDFLPS